MKTKILMGTFTTLLIGSLFVKASQPDFSPFLADTRESSEIGILGGSIMAEDPDNGLFVIVDFPEGALTEQTLITLVLHGAEQPGILGETHIKGITILPEGLYMQEKVRLEVYNPPVDVTEAMILYQVINLQFIVPLGSQVQHEDEGWVEGTFYITGKFSLGTPSAAEVSDQGKKLTAYDPAYPLAHAGERPDSLFALLAGKADKYDFPSYGKTCASQADAHVSASSYSHFILDECLRWQKVLTKVEASLTWAAKHQFMGNTSSANREMLNAQKALQDAIDEYLSKPPPANSCGNYIKAAAKYLESAILLGIDHGDNSPLNRRFEQLIDECSFVFTVETSEWIDHPYEKHDDGSTTMEKMKRDATITCHIPWNKFLVSGNMEIRGEGNMSLHHENHWTGGEENTHEETYANWRATKIEGSVSMNYDTFGLAHPVADITIQWEGEAQTNMWGKRHGNPPYDLKNKADRSFNDYKTYPVEHGYSEKIGDSTVGFSVTVHIQKQPADKGGDPNSCF